MRPHGLAGALLPEPAKPPTPTAGASDDSPPIEARSELLAVAGGRTAGLGKQVPATHGDANLTQNPRYTILVS